MDLLQVRDLKEQETLYDFLLYGIDDNNLNYYAWLLKDMVFLMRSLLYLLISSIH